jgi:hypothetical protein
MVDFKERRKKCLEPFSDEKKVPDTFFFAILRGRSGDPPRERLLPGSKTEGRAGREGHGVLLSLALVPLR